MEFAVPTGDMHVSLITVLCIARLCPAVCGVNFGTCILQGNPQAPALFKNGDLVIGGVFSIHDYLRTEKHTYTKQPQPLECSGRLAYTCRKGSNIFSMILHIFNLFKVCENLQWSVVCNLMKWLWKIGYAIVFMLRIFNILYNII